MFARTRRLLAALLLFCGCESALISTALGQANRPPSDGGSSTEETFPRLRYRWETGKRYQYMVNLTGEVLDSKLDNSAAYFVTSKGLDKSSVQEVDKPTASAFCVHADGYLITCAHVVQDAELVEVSIGGKTYPAKVVSAEESLDLALLKIEAKSLPALPMANSEFVEVGQSIRAFGYPLSDLLGEDLKATSGTVSGIDNRAGRKAVSDRCQHQPGEQRRAAGERARAGCWRGRL